MLPLHYAAFFDAAVILKVLLRASKARGKIVIIRGGGGGGGDTPFPKHCLHTPSYMMSSGVELSVVFGTSKSLPKKEL